MGYTCPLLLPQSRDDFLLKPRFFRQGSGCGCVTLVHNRGKVYAIPCFTGKYTGWKCTILFLGGKCKTALFEGYFLSSKAVLDNRVSCYPYTLKDALYRSFYTGFLDQIVRPVNLILLPNQKTYRKCKDRLKIVMKRATKHAFG